MRELELLLPFLGVFMFALISTYLVGAILTKLYKRKLANEPWLNIFICCIIGATAITVGYSLIKTKGNTVFILAIPLIVYHLVSRKLPDSTAITNAPNTGKLFSGRILFNFLILTLFFIIASYPILKEHVFYNKMLLSLYGDTNFYARVSAFIANTGLENYTLNRSAKGAIPYHYYEMWLNAFFANATSSNIYFTFHFVTIPFLNTLLFAGICALITLLTKREKNYIIVVIAFALVHFTGLYIKYLPEIHPLFLGLRTFLFEVSFSKILPTTIFLTVATILHFQLLNKEAILILFFIPCVSIATAPAIFSVAGLAVLFLILAKTRKQNFSVTISIIVYTLLFLSFFVTNSVIQKELESTTTANIPSITEIAKGLLNIEFLTTFFNVIVGTALSLPFLYILLILAILLMFKQMLAFYRSIPAILVTYLCLNLTGIVIWAATHKMLDSVQLFQIIFLPTTFILVVLTISHFYNLSTVELKERTVTSYLAYAAVLFSLAIPTISKFYKSSINLASNADYPYSLVYLNNIYQQLNSSKQDDGWNGVILNNTADKETIFTKNLNIQWPGATYLPGIHNEVYLTSLTIMDIPRSTEEIENRIEEAYIKNSPFFNFIKKNDLLEQYQKHKHLVQLDYINSKDIDFVIIDASMQGLLPYLKAKKIFKDQKSEQTFVLL
ncbi:hypothetical protein [Rufibacter roseus]|uniref:Uncharacterized protein n=1 Tax=Rufibacter roseus TaxID=1567108 RepID=A0ABW2DL45_9BACT|nr:hypothetical protein [Rufibacter roseus]